MRNLLARWLLAGFVFIACHLQLFGAAGNPQVTVSVFSRLHPRSLSIMAARGKILCSIGAEKSICSDMRIAWQSPRQLQCRWPEGKASAGQRVLIQPEIPGVTLRLRVPDFPDREFRGSFAVHARDSALLLLNTLDLEDYLCGVIGSEMAAPLEALKCQALVSRTYALVNIGRHRNRDYDFCDTTHCQYYRGMPGENREIRSVIEQTRGMALFFRGKLAKVFCHSTCGGMTNTADVAWGGKSDSTLQPVDDGGACRFSPYFRWQARVAGAELLRILSKASGVQVSGFQIEKTASGGWVRTLVLHCIAGNEIRVSGEWFHLALGRQIGWSTFKSSNFSVEESGDHWLFTGRGLGHGVGLCQYGAIQLARQGWDFRQIAFFYFPGTEIRRTSDW
jgi:stage II sporulation protein D